MEAIKMAKDINFGEEDRRKLEAERSGPAASVQGAAAREYRRSGFSGSAEPYICRPSAGRI